MKIKRKHIIIGSVVALAVGLMSFTSARSSQAKNLFKELKIGLHKFRTIGMNGLTSVRLRLDIFLHNPTGEDFSIDTRGLVQPKVLRVYLDNELIGTATLQNVTSLMLKSGGKAVIENIAIDFGLFGIGKKIWALYEANGLNFSALSNELFKRTRVEADIDAFGQMYTFKQTLV